MDQTLRFVGYLRVSTKGQEVSGLGLEAQEATIRRHVQQAGGALVAEFREAESGTKADRPQLAAALAECRRLGATLLIARLDRLARNLRFLCELMESGVDFVACDMPGANRLTLHIFGAVGEEFVRLLRENTKKALAARKARGLPLGESTHRQSWTPRKAIARWKNAQKAREARMNLWTKKQETQYRRAVELHRDRKSMGQIAEILNAEGYHTVGGHPWDRSTVSRLLKKRLFPGEHRGSLDAESFRATVFPRARELREDQHMTLEEIADTLTQEGYTCPKGGRWDYMDVRNLLQAGGVSTAGDPDERRRRKRQATDSILTELREHGVSMEKIAEYLNDLEIPHPEGGPWKYTTVRNHLKDLGLDTSDATAPRVYRSFLLDPAERQRIQARYLELSGRQAS